MQILVLKQEFIFPPQVFLITNDSFLFISFRKNINLYQDKTQPFTSIINYTCIHDSLRAPNTTNSV